MGLRAGLVVNARSRSGRVRCRETIVALRQRGVELEEIVEINSPQYLVPTVSRMVEDGLPLVIVGGGDGTLSSVLPCFIGRNTVFGVLPLGTGNQFARDLQIPSDISAACDIIVHGQVRSVDVGKVNERYFLNVATVGLTTLIAESLSVTDKRKYGRAIYLVALTRALLKVRPFQCSMSIVPPADESGAGDGPEASSANLERKAASVAGDGELDPSAQRIETFMTLQVVIGNGRFHAGPFPLAPDATITDGRLVVYGIAGVSRWHLLRLALNLPLGEHVYLPDVVAYSAVAGAIVANPAQRVTVDGEVVQSTPLRFQIVPRAVRVMTPASFA